MVKEEMIKKIRIDFRTNNLKLANKSKYKTVEKCLEKEKIFFKGECKKKIYLTTFKCSDNFKIKNTHLEWLPNRKLEEQSEEIIEAIFKILCD